MPLENQSSDHVLVDVLDRVLDKGIVIDAAVRVSVVGVELLGVDARVVVASIETYIRHADTIAYTEMAAAPRTATPPPPQSLYAEPIDSVPALGLGASSIPPGTDVQPDSAAHPGSAAADPPTEPDVPDGPGGAAEADGPVLAAEPAAPAEQPDTAGLLPSDAPEAEHSEEKSPGQERTAPGEES